MPAHERILHTGRVVHKGAAPCIPATSTLDATFTTSLGQHRREDASWQHRSSAVNNFVFLALYQYFNGTYFHRVIPGFVVQGATRPARAPADRMATPATATPATSRRQSCKTNPNQSACYKPFDLVLANSDAGLRAAQCTS